MFLTILLHRIEFLSERFQIDSVLRPGITVHLQLRLARTTQILQNFNIRSKGLVDRILGAF